MDRLLGNPTTCPHGNPIPGSDYIAPDVRRRCRASTVGAQFTVSRIPEELEFTPGPARVPRGRSRSSPATRHGHRRLARRHAHRRDRRPPRRRRRVRQRTHPGHDVTPPWRSARSCMLMRGHRGVRRRPPSTRRAPTPASSVATTPPITVAAHGCRAARRSWPPRRAGLERADHRGRRRRRVAGPHRGRCGRPLRPGDRGRPTRTSSSSSSRSSTWPAGAVERRRPADADKAYNNLSHAPRRHVR